MTKQTQNKIIDQAQKLMWFRGYEGTSLNDVVAKAGVSKGAFFHYYPTKQAISQKVIDKYAAEQWFAPLDKHMDGAPSVKTGLMGWIAEIFGAYKGHNFKGGCLLGNLGLELSDQSDAARETIKGHFLELENKLTSYLKPAAEQSKLAMEPRQTARMLIAAIQGATLTTKIHKDNNRAGREFMAIGELVNLLIRD